MQSGNANSSNPVSTGTEEDNHTHPDVGGEDVLETTPNLSDTPSTQSINMSEDSDSDEGNSELSTETILEIDNSIVPSNAHGFTRLNPSPLTIYLDVSKEVFIFAAPIAGFGLTLATVNTFNMLLLKWSGKDDALASMYLVLNDIYFVMSFSKGMLKATSLSISPLRAAGEHSLVGEKARVGLLMSTGLSGLIAGALLSAKPLSNLAGVNHDLTNEVGTYFSAFAIAVPPILWLTLAQQISAGVKHSTALFVIGLSFALSGLPLEYGLIMHTDMGVLGLAIPALFSASVTAIGSAVYLKHSEVYQQYDLFKWQLNDVASQLRDFVTLGLPLGITSVSEHVSPLVISLFIGHWKEAALASQVFSRANSFIDSAIMGLALATGILIGEQVGRRKTALEEGNIAGALATATRQQQIVSTSLLIGFVSATLAATLYVAFPDTLTNALIDFSEYGYQDGSDGLYEHDALHTIDRDATEQLSRAMLYANAIGVVLRGQLHVLMGALSGFKDVVIPPIVSFTCVSGIGLTVGGYLAIQHVNEQGVADPIQLFNVRNLTYLPAIGFMAYRLYQTIQTQKQEVKAAEEAIEIVIEEDEQQLVDGENSNSSGIATVELSSNVDDTEHQTDTPTTSLARSCGETIAAGSAALMAIVGLQPAPTQPTSPHFSSSSHTDTEEIDDDMRLLRDDELLEIESSSSWRCGGMPCVIS